MEFPLTFLQGYVLGTYIPLKFIEFWDLGDFSYFSIWDDEQPIITVKAPRPTPMISPPYTSPWNVPSFKLSHHQELRVVTTNSTNSCSSARHWHTHRTSSPCSLGPRAPGPSQCATIPLSSTSTLGEGGIDQELSACAQGQAAQAVCPHLPYSLWNWG